MALIMGNPARTTRFWRYLIIASLCLLPFAFLFYQAWYSPGIEFLVPSFKGDWVLHSAEKISGTVDFRRQFQLEEIPAKCRIRVRAMLQFSMVVNGQIVEENSQGDNRNWKLAREYDIASMLQSGNNTIVIRVSNPEGPPALLVEAPALGTQEDKVRLSSSTDWESAPVRISENGSAQSPHSKIK